MAGMMTVADYLKHITGAPTVRGAAKILSPAIERSGKSIEMAAHRGAIPGAWYADVAEFATARELPAPPKDLFRTRRADGSPPPREAAA